MKPNPAWDNARRRLFELTSEKRVSYTKLSKLVGMNQTYLQQYMTKNTPIRLPEAVRIKLGEFFRVSPNEFRLPTDIPAPPEPAPASNPLMSARMRTLMRHAIIAGLVAIRESGASLDGAKPADIAAVILRTFDGLASQANNGES